MRETSIGEHLQAYRLATPEGEECIEGFVEYIEKLGGVAIYSEPYILKSNDVLKCEVRRPMDAAAVQRATSPL